jgi:biotin transporter BioY
MRPHLLISRSISIISIFAALNIIGDFIPVSPIVGLEQSRMTFGWVFASLAGIMVGPIFGSISCLMAALIEPFLGLGSYTPFGPLGFTRPAIAALQTGLLSSGRWTASGIILLALIIMWIISPYSRDAAQVLVFHFFAFILMLCLRGRITKGLYSSNRRAQILTVASVVYCGNISRHLYGNLLLSSFASLPAVVFITAMPLTLIEQILFSATSSLIGANIIRLGLRRYTYLG